MLEYSCVHCVCPMFLVWGLVLIWMPVTTHNMLTIIILIGGVVGVEESNACVSCMVGFLCFMAIAALSRWSQFPSCWSGSPACWIQPGFTSWVGALLQGNYCLSKWDLCTHRRPMCHMCSLLWLCSKAAWICNSSSIVFIPDLVSRLWCFFNFL